MYVCMYVCMYVYNMQAYTISFAGWFSSPVSFLPSSELSPLEPIVAVWEREWESASMSSMCKSTRLSRLPSSSSSSVESSSCGRELGPAKDTQTQSQSQWLAADCEAGYCITFISDHNELKV